MLKYRINRRNFNKTRENLQVNQVSIIDFEDMWDDEVDVEYNGKDNGQIMVVCECDSVDKLNSGDKISTTNTLTLTYSAEDNVTQQTFTFDNDYEITGVNKLENSFSFMVDKYNKLEAEGIVSGYNLFDLPEFFEGEEENNIFLYCKSFHYFDAIDNLNEDGIQEIPIYFRYQTTIYKKKDNVNDDSLEETIRKYQYDNLSDELKDSYEEVGNEFVTDVVYFRYYDYSTLTTSYSAFPEYLYKMIFSAEKPIEEEEENPLEEEPSIESDLVGFEIYRETFLFSDKAFYTFASERTFADINIPISNTIENNLLQTELLNEYFVEAEKKKVINRIVDIEKDVYYPCIGLEYSNGKCAKYQDVYTIKFNLHFREHRGDDWIVENESFWNGVDLTENYFNEQGDEKTPVEYDALNDDEKMYYYREPTINSVVTGSSVSDLLTFLDFTNDDVHYQKNKLKKSFLRLSFYDSLNPANQNLISYSTIFMDSGNLFAKYIKYISLAPYTSIMYGRNEYGNYTLIGNKTGIRVDREHAINDETDFDEDKRLSSQMVVKSKNTSKSSSDGFYQYIWKDNESTMPQDLYMKVEFNHAGYGRTIPFMMPFWDKRKHNKVGIKTFDEILEDWKHEDYVVDTTDGRYGIRQYIKYSYIHFKYCYDKENDKHYYYLDPETYGQQEANSNNEIIINLYEAKIV